MMSGSPQQENEMILKQIGLEHQFVFMRTDEKD